MKENLNRRDFLERTCSASATIPWKIELFTPGTVPIQARISATRVPEQLQKNFFDWNIVDNEMKLHQYKGLSLQEYFSELYMGNPG